MFLVFNPVAGGRHPGLLDRVKAALESLGASVAVCETAARGDAARLAGAARGRGYDRLLVAGGDGTINEAVEAIRLGAYDFLTKPVDVEHLQLVIDRALRSIVQTEWVLFSR